MPRVAIVGGGIAGLSAAYYLSQSGIPSTLVESRPRLGGVISTEQVEGCVIEAGPDSFLSVKPAAMELIRELGLADDVIGSNDHLRKTYVLKRGQLMALPDGLMMMIPTRIMPMVTTPLLGWGTKIRMGLETLRAPKLRAGDESVADFVREHYSQEAVDYLAEPLLSGIYGGDPEALSVRSVLPKFVELAERYGSLSKGVLAERKAANRQAGSAPLFRTLKGGLGQLTCAVAAAADKMTAVSGRVETVERTEAGFRLRIGADWLDAARLVLACEAHNAAALAAGFDARLSALLGQVPYSSSMTIAFGFEQRDFPKPLEGFGFLVPRRERKRLVACTWVGTKFSHRVPPGKVVLRCFLGGTEGADVFAEADDLLIDAILEELHRIVGFQARPRFARVFRWPKSMAQYTVGHQRRLSEIEARVAAIPGLHLAGNAYEGIGIPDCIRMGKRAAGRIAAARRD